MEDATPTEREAVLLSWRSKHPEAGPGDQPPPEEAAMLLREIRERAMDIENASLSLLMKQMRVRPTGGGAPQLRGFIFALAVTIGLCILIVGAYYLIAR